MTSTPKVLPQCIAALCATMGGMTMGVVLGYSSPAGALLTSNITDPSAMHLTVYQNSWFSSTSTTGALFGALMGGYFINLLGRRGAMIYSIVPILVGWAFIACAMNFAMLIIGRIVLGFCIGLISLAVPTYVGEFSSPHIRGMLGTGFQIMVMVGFLYAVSLGAAFDNFRWMAGACAIIPCIFSTSMIFNKESPIYLLSIKKVQEAEDALKFFRGNDYTEISSEMVDMKASLEKKNLSKATLSDLKSPKNLKPLIISVGLMFFQQFCGISAVLFNMAIIFQTAGASMSSTLSSIIVASTCVLSSILSAFLIDKAGRKFLLIVSATVMCLSLGSLGVYFYVKDKDPETALRTGWLPLLSLIVYVIGLNIGFGPVAWVSIGELFSPEIKEIAASLATMSSWAFAFIVTLMFAPLQDFVPVYVVYWMFAAFCAISVVFVINYVYETKGKTLSEITEHFAGLKESIELKNPPK